MTDLSQYLPGDVLVVNASKGKGIFSGGFWIKVRNVIIGVNKRSRLSDHVVIVSHRDMAGTLWGIEGKPSSVGYVDCALYLDHGKLIASTLLQPKTPDQRALITKVAAEMLGTPYDWEAILTLGAQVDRINRLWSKAVARVLVRGWKQDTVPGHVICSSFADLAYEKAGLDSPNTIDGTRYTAPDDWSEFIFEHVAAWKLAE